MVTDFDATEPVDQYLRNFSWNKVKYRADKPIAELIDSLQKVCTGGSSISLPLSSSYFLI